MEPPSEDYTLCESPCCPQKGLFGEATATKGIVLIWKILAQSLIIDHVYQIYWITKNIDYGLYIYIIYRSTITYTLYVHYGFPPVNRLGWKPLMILTDPWPP